MAKATLTLRPAKAPVILMAVVGTPFLILGAWIGVEMIHDGAWDIVTALTGVAVFLFGLWLWLEIGTVRICLTPDFLLLRRFWRTRWRVPRESVVLKPGNVGDRGLFPGLRAYEAGKGRHVGEILSVQFRPADLQRLQQALADDQPGA